MGGKATRGLGAGFRPDPCLWRGEDAQCRNSKRVFLCLGTAIYGCNKGEYNIGNYFGTSTCHGASRGEAGMVPGGGLPLWWKHAGRFKYKEGDQ